jgi:hypothetical protein
VVPIRILSRRFLFGESVEVDVSFYSMRFKFMVSCTISTSSGSSSFALPSGYSKTAKKATDEDAEGLEKEVLLAECARVITRNLWTSKVLVNGTQGVIKKIWYHARSDPKKDLPAVIFVDFPGYTGEFSELCLIDVDTDQVFNRPSSSGLGRN